MRLTATLVDPDEVLTIEIDARDRRAFERAGARAMGLSGNLQAAIQTMPDTYLAWLAWHAAARRGDRDDLGSFDDFDARLADVASIDVDEDGEEAGGGELGDPTKPAT